ncbi:TrkH family potassium uptake protein [Candidatus Pelagibacter sp. FZCC0015]|uniref:TrkH family potassium uptake protein n=1 Tax=Candidatus Pelagibacter sp. FZCC0015 TaxID=2268451 RepID=UPI001F1042C5|nr:TrkH family potassium uptake protein [Candidatus Pelagibacter sp. FZCC0015]
MYLNLNVYYFSLVISAIIGIIFYKIKTNQKKPTIFEKILTVLLGYFLMPLILSTPFYLSIYNLSFLNSLFEAVSGFTSTGFTVFENIKHIDQGLILWRSSIQWIGGLYFLYSIIFLIDIYDESLKKSLTNFLSFNSAEILKQSIKILLLYSGLTISIFIILNILGIRSFNSLNLAMTLISSGGFLPENELSSILINDFQIIIFCFLMLISFFSIFFTYNLIFLRNKNLNFFYEDIHLFLYFVVVVSIFFVFFSYDTNFTFSFLSLVSSISNIGISLNVDQANLNFIYILLVIIGGSFFSTSSGLRFLKIYSLTKYSINQILSFSRPKNVFMNKLVFSKINFDTKDINKYFLTIVIFVISLFSLTTLLSLSNIQFEYSFKLAVLTLMNTVNSSAYGISDFNFQNLHFLTKYFLIFFMIIGRVELLSLLLIAKKFLFKN